MKKNNTSFKFILFQVMPVSNRVWGVFDCIFVEYGILGFTLELHKTGYPSVHI